MDTPAQNGWKFVPSRWAQHERYTYRSNSALLKLEFEWEIEKTPDSSAAVVRARAVVNVPFRREQRISWKTRFFGADQAPFGFDYLEETNEVTGTARQWTVQDGKMVYNENGMEQIISPPANVIVYHPLQVPAFFRSFGSALPQDPVTLLVSRRFQVLRAIDAGAVKDANQIRLEAAPITEWGVNWAEAKSGEVLLDRESGMPSEFKIHVPVIGAVSAKLEKRER